MAEIRKLRGVPAKRGMRVVVDGLEGRITASYGLSLMVWFPSLGLRRVCHPTWRVTYFDEAGKELLANA